MKKGFMASDKKKNSGPYLFRGNFIRPKLCGIRVVFGTGSASGSCFYPVFFLNVGSGSTLSGPATQTKILGSKALLVT